jgi:hypothetical protein
MQILSSYGPNVPDGGNSIMTTEAQPHATIAQVRQSGVWGKETTRGLRRGLNANTL